MPTKKAILEEASLLKDVVLASSDGIITTFAVVAGSQGAAFSSKVIVIVGLANLFADGWSMASGNYLAIKSEQQFEKANNGNKTLQGEKSITRHMFATFVPFVVAGSLPLLPYILNLPNQFFASLVMVAISLTAVGVLRGYFTKRNILVSAIETLVVGEFAAFVAFMVGYLLNRFII